ncbi:MAG: long-chain fatty acid--CoA ligase [Bacteroidota bacterium]
MEVRRLFELLAYQEEKYPHPHALSYKSGDLWHRTSSKEALEQVQLIARALLASGLEKGDRVALISRNRTEWCLADLAIMMAGGVVVPMHANMKAEEVGVILEHAEITYAFVENAEKTSLLDQTGYEGLKKVYTFDEAVGYTNLQGMVTSADKHGVGYLRARSAAVRPADLATIIYTSGTTGTPRGVMLSHQNILSNVKAAVGILPLNHTHRVLSFLPLSFMFERMVIYTYLYTGVDIYFAESPDALSENLKEVRPHFISTVPKVLDRVYQSIETYGDTLTGYQKTVFNWAKGVALAYRLDKRQGPIYHMQLRLARKLVLNNWKKALGGEIIGVMSGAAALPEKLCRVFNAAGINVREGYGQTEAAPVLTFNRFETGWVRPGSVGTAIPGVELKIGKNQEILAKGENVMMGYYKDEEATAEVIDRKGWLHTGDMGKIDKDGFVRITGRLKELFKNAGGVDIAPKPIENQLLNSPFVSHALVVGENRPFIGAIIVPDRRALRSWAEAKGIEANMYPELLQHPMVKARFKEEAERVSAHFPEYEHLKFICLVPDEWKVATGELTHTLKVRRFLLTQRYAKLISRQYEEVKA